MWNDRYSRRAYRRRYRGYRYGHHAAWPLIVLAILFFVFIGQHIWVLFLGLAIAVIIAALLSSRNPIWGPPMGTGYQQQNPYYQPGQQPYYQPPEQPPYQPYEQGYQPEQPPAEGQPHEPSPSSYEQYDSPQAQYPQERPPQELPPMEQ